jgi:hypothetical protein
MTPDTLLASYFLQARYTGGAQSKISRIVIHDEEYREGPDSAERIAQYFHTMPDGRKASAHFTCDSNSIIQCVKESVVAYHAPPNADSIGIEHDGYMHQTREEWLDAAHGVPMLKLSAKLTAELCKRHGIPIRKLSWADLRTGKKGICGHVDVSNAFHKTDHGDPGAGFPWDWYLEWVRLAGKEVFDVFFIPPGTNKLYAVVGSVKRRLAPGKAGTAQRKALEGAGVKIITGEQAARLDEAFPEGT